MGLKRDLCDAAWVGDTIRAARLLKLLNQRGELSEKTIYIPYGPEEEEKEYPDDECCKEEGCGRRYVSPMSCAALAGHALTLLEMMRYLSADEAGISVRALHRAIEGGHQQCVAVLLGGGQFRRLPGRVTVVNRAVVEHVVLMDFPLIGKTQTSYAATTLVNVLDVDKRKDMLSMLAVAGYNPQEDTTLVRSVLGLRRMYEEYEKRAVWPNPVSGWLDAFDFHLRSAITGELVPALPRMTALDIISFTCAGEFAALAALVFLGHAFLNTLGTEVWSTLCLRAINTRPELAEFVNLCNVAHVARTGRGAELAEIVVRGVARIEALEEWDNVEKLMRLEESEKIRDMAEILSWRRGLVPVYTPCALCRRPSKGFCGGCHRVRFCSAACLTAAWPVHQRACPRPFVLERRCARCRRETQRRCEPCGKALCDLCHGTHDRTHAYSLAFKDGDEAWAITVADTRVVYA